MYKSSPVCTGCPMSHMVFERSTTDVVGIVAHTEFALGSGWIWLPDWLARLVGQISALCQIHGGRIVISLCKSVALSKQVRQADIQAERQTDRRADERARLSFVKRFSQFLVRLTGALCTHTHTQFKCNLATPAQSAGERDRQSRRPTRRSHDLGLSDERTDALTASTQTRHIASVSLCVAPCNSVCARALPLHCCESTLNLSLSIACVWPACLLACLSVRLSLCLEVSRCLFVCACVCV